MQDHKEHFQTEEWRTNEKIDEQTKIDQEEEKKNLPRNKPRFSSRPNAISKRDSFTQFRPNESLPEPSRITKEKENAQTHTRTHSYAYCKNNNTNK